MSTSTTTTTPEARPAHSTEAHFIGLGDVVLVCLDVGCWRPMTVSSVYREVGAPVRLGGTIHCDPADHTTKAFRGYLDSITSPARIHGRPDRFIPLGYGEDLTEGHGIGNWQRRTI